MTEFYFLCGIILFAIVAGLMAYMHDRRTLVYPLSNLACDQAETIRQLQSQNKILIDIIIANTGVMTEIKKLVEMQGRDIAYCRKERDHDGSQGH